MLRRKATVAAENSLRDRSYYWRVLSDQVCANNIVFAIVGSTGIVFFLVANDRPINIGSLCLPVLSTSEMKTGRVDRPVGWRFFDQSVKPVETPVKFRFLAIKNHLSTKRMYMHILLQKKKLFMKNSLKKSHLLKTLVEWFQAVTNMLWPFRHAHPEAYLGGHCAKDLFGPRLEAKKCKIYVKIA